MMSILLEAEVGWGPSRRLQAQGNSPDYCCANSSCTLCQSDGPTYRQTVYRTRLQPLSASGWPALPC